MSASCSFCYYLINFYIKYIPGNIYTNQIINSLSESAAQGGSLVLLKLFNIKWGFGLSYLITAASCVLVIFVQMHGGEDNWVIPFAVLGAKFGITSAFCYLYFAQVNYFISAYLGLVMGFSNVFGRIVSIGAPIVAELNDPVPMMSTVVVCLLAFCLALSLK